MAETNRNNEPGLSRNQSGREWDPWDPRRLDPHTGPIPAYGRAGQRSVRKATERKRLRREHSRSKTRLSFKAWLRGREARKPAGS